MDESCVERAEHTSVDTPPGRQSVLDHVEFVCFLSSLPFMGLLWLWSLPTLGPSHIHSTETDARTLRQAMVLFRAEQPDAECPSVRDLVEEQYLDSSMRVRDAWDNEFHLACRGRDVYAGSAGPDGVFDTADDVGDPFQVTLWVAGKSVAAGLRSVPSSRR